MKKTLVTEMILAILVGLLLVQSSYADQVTVAFPAAAKSKSGAWTAPQLEVLRAFFAELEKHESIKVDAREPVPAEYEGLLAQVKALVAQREGFQPSGPRDGWRLEILSKSRIAGAYIDSNQSFWFDYRFSGN